MTYILQEIAVLILRSAIHDFKYLPIVKLSEIRLVCYFYSAKEY